jgi:hypothetical protein
VVDVCYVQPFEFCTMAENSKMTHVITRVFFLSDKRPKLSSIGCKIFAVGHVIISFVSNFKMFLKINRTFKKYLNYF